MEHVTRSRILGRRPATDRISLFPSRRNVSSICCECWNDSNICDTTHPRLCRRQKRTRQFCTQA